MLFLPNSYSVPLPVSKFASCLWNLLYAIHVVFPSYAWYPGVTESLVSIFSSSWFNNPGLIHFPTLENEKPWLLLDTSGQCATSYFEYTIASLFQYFIKVCLNKMYRTSRHRDNISGFSKILLLLFVKGETIHTPICAYCILKLFSIYTPKDVIVVI